MIEPPDELEIGALSMGEEDHQQVSEERRNRFLELIDDDFWLDELWEVFFPKQILENKRLVSWNKPCYYFLMKERFDLVNFVFKVKA